jgi:hypothetical protein
MAGEVTVVIGAGLLGQAIARRVSLRRHHQEQRLESLGLAEAQGNTVCLRRPKLGDACADKYIISLPSQLESGSAGSVRLRDDPRQPRGRMYAEDNAQ